MFLRQGSYSVKGYCKLRSLQATVAVAGLGPGGHRVLTGILCGLLLIQVYAETGLVVGVNKAVVAVLGHTGEHFQQSAVVILQLLDNEVGRFDAAPLLQAQILSGQIDVDVGCMSQRAHVAGAVPADAHTILLAEHLQLAGR